MWPLSKAITSLPFKEAFFEHNSRYAETDGIGIFMHSEDIIKIRHGYGQRLSGLQMKDKPVK